MGTKRVLAPLVSEVITSAQPGILLDVFAGMCAVGEAVGTSRQVWSNDIQVFASEVAKALFTCRNDPLSPLTSGDLHFQYFKKQRQRLQHIFLSALAEEEGLLAANSYDDFEDRKRKFEVALAADLLRCRLRSPHLFSKTYAGTYFGIRQTIEIDAIIFALRENRKEKRIKNDEFRWAIIALGRALLKISNSTGHFAQYLKPKANTYRRHLALRRRGVWAEWLNSLSDMTPLGTPEWRKKNRVFNQDTLKLLPALSRRKADVSVIYADPPYTDDQYSRFYHLLETLCLYDYPSVTGAGLYRTERFQTTFSLKSKSQSAIQQLVNSAARTGADLVLSYPENGLANKGGADIAAMLRAKFRKVETSKTIQHNHSTFGASKGLAQSPAVELIYFARSA